MSYVDRDQQPGGVSLALAVIFPAFVIGFELVTGMCADALFDPMPTLWHALLIGAVPLTNFLLWRAARYDAAPGWLFVLAGASLAISASYALLMAPIMPVALVAIIFFGLGLLPFAPLFALIWGVRWTLRAAGEQRIGWRVASGAVGGLALLALADLPATATFIALDKYRGDAGAQRHAVQFMRDYGDKAVLLRMAYGDSARATGLISFVISGWGSGMFGEGGADSFGARELYYRVTGEPFNAVPAPNGWLRGERVRDRWDADLGGESVGQRVRGVTLESSRIDGSIAAADNLGYFEWTAEFRNIDAVEHEARFVIAMPEGAVASRATLWIAGEPREAAVAGRAEARAAYEKVAVRQRRDPLLVTTDGGQRLLVQAFPILAGGTIKLRVGFSAPLTIAPDGKRSIALPAMVERNFELTPDLRHAVWIEGDAPLSSGGPGLAPGQSGNQLLGKPTDADLLAHRTRILLPALTAPSDRIGAMPTWEKLPALGVRQTIAPMMVPGEGPLTIVLDGSKGNEATAKALAEALDAMPAGLPVGLLIASEEPVAVAAAPWDAAQRKRLTDAIAATRFVGGQDSVPALGEALAGMASGQGSLLWIHAAQPVTFSQSSDRVLQLLERSKILPRLIRYQATPGPAFALKGARWFEKAREVPPSGDVRADLRGVLAGLGGGTRWTVTRSAVPAKGTEGSAHIVRLWGAGQLIDAVDTRGKDRDAAIAMARRLNLITPISGAVVLERAAAYTANGLPVPGAEDVPTVPEPHEWALMAIIAGLLAWVFRKRLRMPQRWAVA